MWLLYIIQTMYHAEKNLGHTKKVAMARERTMRRPTPKVMEEVVVLKYYINIYESEHMDTHYVK